MGAIEVGAKHQGEGQIKTPLLWCDLNEVCNAGETGASCHNALSQELRFWVKSPIT